MCKRTSVLKWIHKGYDRIHWEIFNKSEAHVRILPKESVWQRSDLFYWRNFRNLTDYLSKFLIITKLKIPHHRLSHRPCSGWPVIWCFDITSAEYWPHCLKISFRNSFDIALCDFHEYLCHFQSKRREN